MKLKVNGSDIQIPDELDSTVNFKLNSKLKEEFEKVCKSNHSNMSRELKIFMTKSISMQTTDTKKWFFM